LKTLDTDQGSASSRGVRHRHHEGITAPRERSYSTRKINGSFHMALGAGYPGDWQQERIGSYWDLVQRFCATAARYGQTASCCTRMAVSAIEFLGAFV